MGVKFRRQVPVGSYIVDLLSLEIKLIIEIDGSQHGKPSAREQDRERDQFLTSEGYQVLRYWAHDITNNLEACLEHLGAAIEARRAIPSVGVPTQI